MRKYAVVFPLLLLVNLASALGMTLINTISLDGRPDALAFSDNGNLAVAHYDDCVYFFSLDGTQLNSYCGDDDMDDVSYAAGIFAVAGYDQGAIFLFSKAGTFIRRVDVGDPYDTAVTMLPNGNFIACDGKCGLFTADGDMIWSFDSGTVRNGPAVYQGYVYIPSLGNDKLYIVKDGMEVNSISYDVGVKDVGVCNNYLIVVTADTIYAYELSDPVHPQLLWYRGGLATTGGGDGDYSQNLALAPDCRYAAVADSGNDQVKIFRISDGELVYTYSFNDAVRGIAWWKDVIAVSVDGFGVYIYRLEGYTPYLAPPQPRITRMPLPLSEFLAKAAAAERAYIEVLNARGIVRDLLGTAAVKVMQDMVIVDKVRITTQELYKKYVSLDNALGDLNRTVASINLQEPAAAKVFEAYSYASSAELKLEDFLQTYRTLSEEVQGLSASPCGANATKALLELLEASNSLPKFLKVQAKVKRVFGSVDGLMKCLAEETKASLKENFRYVQQWAASVEARARGSVEEAKTALELLVSLMVR
ncbi:MAG: hypothetical protein GXO07_00005 [Crenarchaeota archaeon]|nr:hypothetical protein [Thermoproteota archaeon]